MASPTSFIFFQYKKFLAVLVVRFGYRKYEMTNKEPETNETKNNKEYSPTKKNHCLEMRKKQAKR